MLKVPRLDEISYEQRVRSAIEHIPERTTLWTDFNEHDPGITVVQTFAWLMDMLDYYMNATGDVHVRKYLKMLGILPVQARPAEAFLELQSSQDIVEIRAGTRIYSGDICFELPEDCSCEPNALVAYYNEADGVALNLTAFLGDDDDFAPMFAKGEEESAVYFGFQKPFHGRRSFYVSVQEPKQRAPFEESFRLGHICWEFFGANGWQKIEGVTDRSFGFLKSGVLMLDFPQRTVAHAIEKDGVKAHFFRCVLQENHYDTLPKLATIYANPLLVRQQESICRSWEFEYQGEKEFVIPWYLPGSPCMIIGVGLSDGSFQIDDEGWQPLLDEKLHAWKIVRKEQGENIAHGTKIQAIAIAEAFVPHMRRGVSDGCIHQKFSIDDAGMGEIMELGLSLVREEEDESCVYECWQMVEDLEQAGFADKVFLYDRESMELVFGDGIHGQVPKQGSVICITWLVLSGFSGGNVVKNEISRMVPEAQQSLRVWNPENACGGRDEESVQDMLKRLRSTVFDQHRLVTEEDYRALVMKTPGLMIENVEVMPGRQYGQLYGQPWDLNEVILVVKPYSAEQRPVLSKIYETQIKNYLEPYRLINTKLRIVSPSYVGVEVSARIRTEHRNGREEDSVRECLHRILDYRNQKSPFGKDVIYGKVFTELEALEGILQVDSLSLDGIGKGAGKNERGDLLLHRDALSFLKSAEIEFC